MYSFKLFFPVLISYYSLLDTYVTPIISIIELSLIEKSEMQLGGRVQLRVYDYIANAIFILIIFPKEDENNGERNVFCFYILSLHLNLKIGSFLIKAFNFGLT